ncbi:hypothetical protein FF80_03902 [Devosia sp. LC5]|nr:hypothetical protein FF80_03902 [Devosia sp. LC5]
MPLLEKTSVKSPSTQLSELLDDGFLLQNLPIGVYVCDADGLITRFNPAAAELWGREPKLGEPDERFCGSYRLLDLDDTQIPTPNVLRPSRSRQASGIAISASR